MSAVATETALTVVRVGLLGFGGVGQAVVRGATTSSARLAEAGLLIKCVAALVRDEHKPRVAPSIPVVTDAAAFPFDRCDVVVEALGGIEPARTLVTSALARGIPVVTANKSLVAAHGLELQQLAEAHGTSLYFEAAVLAGVPCVNTLARRPLASGVGAFAGILNGTSHYLLTQVAAGVSYGEALREAVARGYAEPASDNDVSGRDAAEKLVILLHLSGCADVVVDDLPRRSIEDLEPWHLDLARRLGGVLKPVAIARPHAPRPGAWVGPAFVPHAHPFAQLSGVGNVLTVGAGTDAVTFSGPGAGPDVTAATILDDVAEIVAGRRGPSRAPVTSPAAPVLRQVPESKWFLAVDYGSDASGTTGEADIAEFVAARHLPAVCVTGAHPRFALITAPASAVLAREVADALIATGACVTCLPVVEEVSRG